jgi:hypothetical protein
MKRFVKETVPRRDANASGRDVVSPRARTCTPRDRRATLDAVEPLDRRTRARGEEGGSTISGVVSERAGRVVRCDPARERPCAKRLRGSADPETLDGEVPHAAETSARTATVAELRMWRRSLADPLRVESLPHDRSFCRSFSNSARRSFPAEG